MSRRQQAQAAVPFAASTGLLVGARDVVKPRRRHEVFIRRAEQRFCGLSTRLEVRCRHGDRGRLSGQVGRLHQTGTASSDARRKTHQSRRVTSP